MLAKDILKSKGGSVVTLGDGATLDEAIELLAERNIGAVLVMSGDTIAGILSERDIMRVLAGAPTGFRATSVREVMTADVATRAADDTVMDLLQLMTERRFRHVPIVEDGKLLGLISIGDAVKARIAEVEGEAEALKSYITAG